MTFAVRFCVRCAAEDLPWHSWPPQALEELADEIGIGQDPRALLDSIRAQRDGRPDANAERLEQLHSDQFDILSLCVASNSKDLARVALVADLLSTARSTAAARRGPAAVAYTVARSYAHEGAWEHATWWSEFAVGHDEFGAYADLINAIARAGVDTEEARLACQRCASWSRPPVSAASVDDDVVVGARFPVGAIRVLEGPELIAHSLVNGSFPNADELAKRCLSHPRGEHEPAPPRLRRREGALAVGTGRATTEFEVT